MTSPIDKADQCEKDCGCPGHAGGDTRLIVLTGGPGAGKTAALEIMRKMLCRHTVLLPEAASIIFGGGFWRLGSLSARLAAQRAILHVQQEMERMACEEKTWPVVLCDRGLLDGLSYWQGPEDGFWEAGRTSLAAEYARYHAVIHLRTPDDRLGYNFRNPLRTESATQARALDDRIAAIWSGHPRYHVIECEEAFLTKVQNALDIVLGYMPECCADSLRQAA